MIGHHEAGHAVRRLDERGSLGQSDLNGGGAPWNEACQFAFTDALQRLVHLHAM